MLDIDKFKNINDTYEHQEGDAILSDVTARIQSAIPSADVVGRYGGEEFIVYLQVERLNECMQAVKGIQDSIEQTTRITLSIGVAYLSVQHYTLEQIINCADKALYQAKNTGKNKVVIYKKHQRQ